MRKILFAIAAAAATIGGPAALVTPAFSQTVSLTPSGHYSVETTLIGAILDDPAAAAVLQQLIPAVYANEMFQNMGRDQTLRGVQQYEPVGLSNENLAKIQAEFDKLPPKQ